MLVVLTFYVIITINLVKNIYYETSLKTFLLILHPCPEPDMGYWKYHHGFILLVFYRKKVE